MFSIRVTAPDGTSQTVPFQGTVASVGRSPDNTVVLGGQGVSGHHCQLEVIGGICTLKERGSTNGTWLNHHKLDEPTVISENDRIYVGSYLLELVSVAPMSGAAPAMPMPSPVGMGGPILRAGGADRAWRELHGRLDRYAEQWEEAGRPDRLALSASELRQAQRWLKQARPDANPPVTHAQRELIEASAGAVRRRTLRLVLSLAAGFVVLAGATATAILLWPERNGDVVADVDDTGGSDDGAGEDAARHRRDRVVDDAPERRPEDERIEISEEIPHEVIPIETLTDIAARYGVTVTDIAEWNTINPDEPVTPGTKLLIKKPKKRPLPQQKIQYEVERGETSWTKLSERFDVSVQRLRAYNPESTSAPKAGDTIAVWVDPRPYKPREPRQAIPDFEADPSAVAIGAPNDGHLENGIEMPKNDKLYMRRRPRLMYGSAYVVSNLQKAVAMFRQDLDFDGVLVLSDISKKGGGLLNPHKSHQQGRDIDIWLPTLRGVFKAKYLTEDGDSEWGRRPEPEEADWFATWGLVRALAKTGAVQDVFLDLSLHPRVYDAAKLMGATEEELDEMIQWPRKYPPTHVILKHSDYHIHHIHVRFKCAPYEKSCRARPARGESE